MFLQVKELSVSQGCDNAARTPTYFDRERTWVLRRRGVSSFLVSKEGGTHKIKAIFPNSNLHRREARRHESPDIQTRDLHEVDCERERNLQLALRYTTW